MGIRSTNLPAQYAIDELLANVTSDSVMRTARVPIASLASQLAGTGAFIFGNMVYVATRTQLLAITPDTETTGGVVLNDSTAAYNGYYTRVAAAWVRQRGLPDTLAFVTLAGSANAQTGDLAAGVDPATVLEFIATPTTANTGPMTLSHEGETPKPVLNFAGNALSAGEWATFVRYRLDGLGNYRLTIDAASAASAAASASSADADRIAAEAAAASASAALSSVVTTTFATKAAAEAYAPTVAPSFLRLAGYAAAGDGGGALYKKVVSEPSHIGKFSITLDDAVTVVWYEIAEEVLIPDMLGAVGDGAADDRAAVQAAIDLQNTRGGGRVIGGVGKTYRVVITTSVTDDGLIVKPDVTLQFANIELECTGTVYGIRVMSNAKVLDNIIATTISATPGSSAPWHAPIGVGAAYGDVTSVGAVGDFINASGWEISGNIVSTVRSGGTMICGIGGVNHGKVNNNTLVGNALSAVAIGFDWGSVGDVASGDVPGTRTRYDASQCYTVHPNNIEIGFNKIGSLTLASGAHAVRLSGCHTINVHDNECEAVVGPVGGGTAAFFHTAGDLGYEFAIDYDARRRALKGTIFERNRIWSSGLSISYYCDAYADNIALAQVNSFYISTIVGTFQDGETVTGGTSAQTATVTEVNTTNLLVTSQSGAFTPGETITGGTSGATATLTSVGYAPIWDVQYGTDIIFRNNIGRGDGLSGVTVSPGMRLRYMTGGKVIGNSIQFHQEGIAVEEDVTNMTVEGNYCNSNREEGICIGNAGTPTEIRVINNTCTSNGIDAAYTNCAGIKINTGAGHLVSQNRVGGASEGFQDRGIEVTSSCSKIVVTDNYVHDTAGGAAYVIGSTTSYEILALFSGNTAGPGVGSVYSGANIVPYASVIGPDGVDRRKCYAARAALTTTDRKPSGGAWVAGESITYIDPVSGGYEGSVCITSGSVGTWAYGAVLGTAV